MDKKPTKIAPELFKPWVDKCCEILKGTGTILYPTDTIWGIGCDATNEVALNRVFNLKKRPKDKPFILLAADTEMIENYVDEIHPKVDQLLRFHTRPLTVVYPIGKNLPDLAIHESGSVAFRIPQDDFCQALIRAFGKPLVSSSANISDDPFPSHFGEISSKVISQVDYIVPYRQMDKEANAPSVMVTLSEKEELVFLRK